MFDKIVKTAREEFPPVTPYSRVGKVTYTELLSSGKAHAPSEKTKRENPYGPRVFSSPQIRAVPTYKRKSAPVIVYIIALLVLLFVCIIPAINIMLGAA